MGFDLIDYPDREMLAIDLANQLAGDLRTALSHDERAVFSVPGGSSPGPVFDALCAADLDWDRVDVLLNDERWVDEDHPRSNTALLRRRLLTEGAADASLLPLYAPYPAPEGALDLLSPAIEERLPLSVLLLGMGEDGHTASLFPGADQLTKALAPEAPPLLAMRAPGAPEPRITLSARVLNGALKKHILIFGAQKRAVLEAARHADPADMPVRAVLDGAIVHWAE